MFPAVDKRTFRTNLKIGGIYKLKRIRTLLDNLLWGFLYNESGHRTKRVYENSIIIIIGYEELVSSEGHYGSTTFKYKIFYDNQIWYISLSEHDQEFCFEELKE